MYQQDFREHIKRNNMIKQCFPKQSAVQTVLKFGICL